MKKITSIFCALVLLSSQASAASGAFVGLDYLHAKTINKASNNSLSGPIGGDKTNDSSSGYGINAGLRFDPLLFYISGEVFYENLNSSAKGFAQNNQNQGVNIGLNERFGAKGNVGFTILPWLTPFVTYGVARVKYDGDQSSWREAPLYGAGIIFDIPATNFSVKAAYDLQRINLPYQNAQSKTNLRVARVGVSYTF